MEVYNLLAGALVMGAMLLVGFAVTFVLVSAERALRTAEGRAAAGRVCQVAAGVALLVGIWLGFGRLAFELAFDPARAYLPQAPAVRWQPAGEAAGTSFDRFDYGSTSNAEIARRS